MNIIFDKCLYVVKFIIVVMVFVFYMISFNCFFFDQYINGVSQLNFIISVWRGFCQQWLDISVEDIMFYYCQVGWCNVSFWFFNYVYYWYVFVWFQGFVFVVNYVISGYVFDRFNYNLVGVSFIEVRDYFSEVIVVQIGFIFIQNNVWQNNCDWFIFYYWMGVQYCVIQIFCQVLMNLYNSYVWWVNRLYFFQQLVFYMFFQYCFQFKIGIEMVFDRVF